MNDKLVKCSYPDFLKGDDFKFNLKEVLKDSVYYPCSATDGKLVKVFRGNFFSFVHVDYGLTKKQIDDALIQYPFKGFRIIYRESLDPHELVPTAFKNIHFNSVIKGMTPFAEWLIFENEEKERFSLLHICAEGVESYRDLYTRNKLNPIALAIIYSDGFSSNWTEFASKPHLWNEVMRFNVRKPRYLFIYMENRIWREFDVEIGYFRCGKYVSATIYERIDYDS